MIGFAADVGNMVSTAVTVTNNLDFVGQATDLTFQFDLATEVLPGTLFRFTFPSILTVGTPVCNAVAYDINTPAITGPFSCVGIPSPVN